VHGAHFTPVDSPHSLDTMIDKRLLDELGERLGEAAKASPAQDLEKNLRALLGAFFDRFDVVLREDFDVQKRLLERAQAKLAALEARLGELEARSGRDR
jgi:BMFP domain-containing protein YqiC